MPKLPNHRHERFAIALSEGKTKKVAYREAGYFSTENAAEASASQLSKNPRVASRLGELRAKAARRSEVTVDSLVAELDEMLQLATRQKQPAAGVAAIMGKAKLLGLIVDKAEVATTVRKPLREPSEVKHMTLEEWQEKFAPRRVDPGSNGPH